MLSNNSWHSFWLFFSISVLYWKALLTGCPVLPEFGFCQCYLHALIYWEHLRFLRIPFPSERPSWKTVSKLHLQVVKSAPLKRGETVSRIRVTRKILSTWSLTHIRIKYSEFASWVTAALGRNAIVKHAIYQSCTLPHSFINQISLQSLTTSPSEKLIQKGEVRSYLPSPTMHALSLLWISDAPIPGRKQQNLALSLGDVWVAFNIQKA